MPEITDKKLPVDRFYDERKRFSIIGLTGMAGSGCSSLAKYMSSKDFLKLVRKPKDILVEEIPSGFEDNELAFQNDKQGLGNKAIGSLVFKQKYTICYDFAQQYYKGYKVIKYTHVIWLYILLFIKSQQGVCSKDILKQTFVSILKDKYRPRRNENSDVEYKNIIEFTEETRNRFIQQVLSGYPNWDGLCKKLNQLKMCYVDDLDNSKGGVVELYEFAYNDSLVLLR